MSKLADRRDIDFLLKEVLEIQNLTKLPYFADHSEEVFDMVLDAVEKMAVEVIAPTNKDGDTIGLKLENGRVITPDSFKAAYKAFYEGGWIGIVDRYEIGGQQLPHALGAMCTSFMGAANHSLLMGPGLTHGATKLVDAFGTDRQKEVYMQPMLEGRFGGTMCLTEPNAGSDVGNLTTVAKRNEDGTFSIKGTKIFISWGDSDITENTVHPVLARIEGDPAGTKGISIFLVPTTRLDGTDNDVQVSGIEEKMGIHGSPTCTMVFGENNNCVGELLGEERQGMKIMFKMMNGARLETGIQGLALSEPAYQYALDYARERFQGSSVENFKNADAPRVSIMVHPDVRRMIIDMRGKVEGMRALIGYMGMNMDLAHAGEGTEAKNAELLTDLLMPIVKSWCTDIGFDVNNTAIQTLGGHGFLSDHPLEQYMRDMKIASLYEGTNGIQAMDLLGRKLGMKGGSVLMDLIGRIDAVVSRAPESLKAEATLVGELKNILGQTAMGLGATFAGGDINSPLLAAKPFLDAMGDVVVAWLLLWEAEVATQKLDALKQTNNIDDDGLSDFCRSNVDAAFYFTKIRTARYFILRYLPETKGRFEFINSKNLSPAEAILCEEDMAS